MSIRATMREVESESETWKMQINKFYAYSDWYLMEIFVRADSNLGIVVYFVFNKTSEKAAYIMFPTLLFFTFRNGMFYQYRAELDRDFLIRYGVHWEKLRQAFERSR
ncbi:hypothetical protein ABUL39_09805 [Rhodothermus marinus]|uniref:hypothetical protein n=1 Tax=Rhodothermus marinus TaxID=29549 RepID=UPI0037C5D896